MFETAVTTIEQRLASQWVTTAIDYDNVNFKPTLGTPFVRLQIEWTDTNQVSVGGRNRGEGYIDLSIFVPRNTGTLVANGMADDLAAIFNRYSNNGLHCKVARTIRVGQQEEWYQLKVLVPFTYDECF